MLLWRVRATTQQREFEEDLHREDVYGALIAFIREMHDQGIEPRELKILEVRSIPADGKEGER